MFGNVRGWLISGAIFAFTVLLIWKQGTMEPISPVSKAKVLAVAKEPPTTSVDPKSLVPPGTNDCDAGEKYRQAAMFYKQNRRKFDNYNKSKDKAKDFENIREGIDLIVEGAGCARMNLFGKKVTEAVNYDNSKPYLEELQQLGRIAVEAGASRAMKPATAAEGRKYIEAAFTLGRNLYEERVVFEEFRIGAEMMGNAAGILAKFVVKEGEQFDKLNKLVQDTSIGEKYKVVWATISGIPEEGKTVAFPGDIFDLAQNGKEPMWQTEAILKLGRLRWMRGVKYGDQKGAMRVLKQLADRTDLPPNAKAAAIAARDLDVEKFRTIGGGS